VQSRHPSRPHDGPPGPRFALCAHFSQVTLVFGINHFCVCPFAEVREVLEELLVPEVEEVHLRVVQRRVHVLVQCTVPCPQFIVEVRTSLTGKLAMKNQDVPLDAAVGVVVGDSGERVWREEGRNELLVLAVLPVLRTLDVPTGELEGIANIDYPDRVDCAVVFPLHEVGEDVARDVG